MTGLNFRLFQGRSRVGGEERVLKAFTAAIIVALATWIAPSSAWAQRSGSSRGSEHLRRPRCRQYDRSSPEWPHPTRHSRKRIPNPTRHAAVCHARRARASRPVSLVVGLDRHRQPGHTGCKRSRRRRRAFPTATSRTASRIVVDSADDDAAATAKSANRTRNTSP